jgi:hypothetical protein
MQVTKVKLAFMHDNPDEFSRIKIYRSNTPSSKKNLVTFIPKYRLQQSGDLFTCVFSEKEKGQFYYSIAACNRAGESYAASSATAVIIPDHWI